MSQPPEVDPEIDLERYAAARDEGQTLDVREPSEYVEAHLPDVRLIPMGQIPARMAEIEKGKPVYVVCAVGSRSLAVADYLRAQGYDAYSVAGGTMGWIRSGRPFERGE